MKRYCVCILSELEPGSRFYFAGDRKKTVYTLNNATPFETKKQKGFFINYANCRADGSLPDELQLLQFKTNRKVIFLRNINLK